jgi:hypothetical protein
MLALGVKYCRARPCEKGAGDHALGTEPACAKLRCNILHKALISTGMFAVLSAA